MGGGGGGGGGGGYERYEHDSCHIFIQNTFLYATHCHDLFYITVKCHDNIPQGI